MDNILGQSTQGIITRPETELRARGYDAEIVCLRTTSREQNEVKI